jgi:hypothetical protein
MMDELALPKRKLSHKGSRQKGRRLEREIAQMYREFDIDKTAEPMPMSGAMDNHKGDILKKHDHEFVDECKNQEKTKIWAWWDQTEAQARGLEKPVLFIKKNYEKAPLAIIRARDYFDMRAEIKQLREQLNVN